MKNNYEVRGEVTAIFLNSPKYGPMETLISTSKLIRAKEFPNMWYVRFDDHTNSFYAVGNMTVSLNKRRVFGLQQWITGLISGMDADHFNHDTLNNTDGNLRILTPKQNMQNRKGSTSNSSSGVRGVNWHKASNSWNVQLRVDGKRMSFGYFSDVAEAEKVAIEARKRYMPFSTELQI